MGLENFLHAVDNFVWSFSHKQPIIPAFFENPIQSIRSVHKIIFPRIPMELSTRIDEYADDLTSKLYTDRAFCVLIAIELETLLKN